ncbi:DUF4123 domain-containing protein [Pseudomonas sp. CCI1.2]|uniref:DUF4123 domain-containing protein n=1 Tax=unclassified Pseudomonas TaxID=196821 RepID=UPI002AC96409|nr:MULTISPECIES: DUF4123 domain-containing protein [unclassified Pseudomonas]MEB0094448.1 DUF4123 domain-containing protein [Pseudomonas sp. CCI4.2]MEB0123614.1 DUF4123 domain-containing protein [Pseudomonas sp. CCI1.2]WPX55504.1 DUF4123 domain-containing protein [Pseudomonas sp. CCI4.2]
MSIWMLLEPRKSLLAELFQHVDHPEFTPLFASTEMAAYVEFSPLLVADDSGQALSRSVRLAPGDWPGLIIESEHSCEALLAHLRHILIVRFDQTRTGMLRYWNPAVAERLFSACTEENIASWLGPIDRVHWYSADATEWQTRNTPHAASWLPTGTPSLLSISVEQSRSLNQPLQSTISNGQES